MLAAILCVQAALSLRLHNTAFEDEALYLYSGHLEIAHWLHGTALQGNYPSYFSGAPALYPVLGALADSVGGLAAARAVSLIAMLTTTGLLYSLTRKLFNERIGLCAAVIFSVTESALFLGHLATYDAPALCLLAVASWIVVSDRGVPLAALPARRADRGARGGQQVRRAAVRAHDRVRWPAWPPGRTGAARRWYHRSRSPRRWAQCWPALCTWPGPTTSRA